jgi:hypothetical protein
MDGAVHAGSDGVALLPVATGMLGTGGFDGLVEVAGAGKQ